MQGGHALHLDLARRLMGMMWKVHISSDNLEAITNFGKFVAEVQPYAFELLFGHGGMPKCIDDLS